MQSADRADSTELSADALYLRIVDYIQNLIKANIK